MSDKPHPADITGRWSMFCAEPFVPSQPQPRNSELADEIERKGWVEVHLPDVSDNGRRLSAEEVATIVAALRGAAVSEKGPNIRALSPQEAGILICQHERLAQACLVSDQFNAEREHEQRAAELRRAYGL